MPESWEDTFDEVKRKNENVRRKMFIEALLEKIPAIDPDLAFLTPAEILKAMDENETIRNYHKRVLEDFEPRKKEIGLLFPDAERKPWTRDKTVALSYRHLFTSMKNLKMEEDVAIYTMSPLLGIVPEEWYDSMPMYDSSGTQSFMVRRRGLEWSSDQFKEIIDRSAAIVSKFLDKNHESCSTWHVIYRAPSVHQRIFEAAMDINPVPIWPHKTRKSLAKSYLQMRKILSEIKEHSQR